MMMMFGQGSKETKSVEETSKKVNSEDENVKITWWGSQLRNDTTIKVGIPSYSYGFLFPTGDFP
jgi:hypothetical protein